MNFGVCDFSRLVVADWRLGLWGQKRLTVRRQLLLKCAGSFHKRQKAQAPTPQAPIRNLKTRKVADAKVHNRYTNLNLLNLT